MVLVGLKFVLCAARLMSLLKGTQRSFVFRSVMPKVLMFSNHLCVCLKVGELNFQKQLELKALDITNDIDIIIF